MIIKFNVDGSINEIIGSNIFQYSIGSNSIEMQIDKPQDSSVSISLVRADGEILSAKPCTPKIGGDLSAWVYVFGTAGSPDLVVDGDLDIAFTVTKNGVSLNTEHYTGTVQTSYNNGYIPIDPDTAEIIEAQINTLQLEKLDRIDALNVPAHIDFLADGAKTANVLYYNFTHDVVDLNGDTVSRSGAILVTKDENDVQIEFFMTSNKDFYARTFSGTAENFVNVAADFLSYFYTKEDADERFMHLTGNELVEGTKTFIDSPVVPNPSANTHAINRETMYNYTYSKAEVNNLTSPISFATYQNFIDWLAGTYSRPDGILPSDLLVGKKVIIQEAGQNNYQVAEVPVVDITDFKILVEDNKTLAEIGATPYKTIEATNGQDFVEELKDEIDTKAQVYPLDDLTILTTEWTAITVTTSTKSYDIYYYDYFNASYTNPVTQSIKFDANTIEQNLTIQDEQIVFYNPQGVVSGSTFGVRIYVNKVPSVDFTFKVKMLITTSGEVEADFIPASAIVYNNTTSGLIADDVQDAIDELKGLVDGSGLNLLESATPTEIAVLGSTPKQIRKTNLISTFNSATHLLPDSIRPRVAMFTAQGKLGSDVAPTDTSDFSNKSYVDGLHDLTVHGDTIYGGTVVTNINTIARSGFYEALGTATGAPDAGYNYTIVHTNSNAGTTEATQIATAKTADYRYYVRTKVAGTWSDWIGSYWNSTYKTWSDIMPDGVVLERGQEEHIYGKAEIPISNGIIVAYGGVQGEKILFKIPENGDIRQGLTTQSFATNQEGKVTTFGMVRGINTNAWAEGTLLYDDGVGNLTSTRPENKKQICRIGFVVKQANTPSSNDGIIFVEKCVEYNEYETLYSDATGSASVDLSSYTFTDGEELRVHLRTGTVGGIIIKDYLVKTSGDGTTYIDDYDKRTSSLNTGTNVITYIDYSVLFITATKTIYVQPLTNKSWSVNLSTPSITADTTQSVFITKILRKL